MTMPRKVTIADVFTVVDAAALFEVVYDNTVIGEYWIRTRLSSPSRWSK